jgi:tetratricopeptide (TPR) repeat protein
LFAALSVYTAGSAIAGSWESTICAADAAEKLHRLGEAEKLYILALKQAESFGEGDPKLFLSIKGLADLYCELKEKDKAKQLYLRYLRMADRLNYAAESSEDRLDILMNLAAIANEKGRMTEAIYFYRKALPLAKHLLGENSEKVATINSLLGACCYVTKRYDEGIEAVTQTLNIHQRIQPNSLQVADDLAQLAGLYGNKHDFAQADTLGRQALAIRSKLCKPGDILIVRSIQGLAINKSNQHNNDEAIKLFNQGFHMAEQAFGKDSLSMSVYMIQLASAYQDRGDYRKAIPLYEKALAIQKKVLKPGGDNRVRVTTSLAECYLKTGNSAAAQHVCQDYLKFVANAKVSDEALSKVKKILDKCP